MRYTVLALYKFVDLPDFAALKAPLQQFCDAQKLCGTLLLAQEGINGTVAGSAAAIEALFEHLRDLVGLDEPDVRRSTGQDSPFHRMKVRLKKEIVTMGVPGVDPTKRVGQYVEPEDWDALISRNDVTVIDTRNDFECRVGTFKGAANPHTTSFGEFPAYVEKALSPDKHKHVAMFCTGGIRCEKASSYMLQAGFENVYHLRGGILRYLERVPQESSTWEGECFVFDQRVTLQHGLKEGTYQLCFGCQSPLSPAERTDSTYEAGVACPYCHDELSDERRTALRQRAKQIRLAQRAGNRHVGAAPALMQERKAQKLAAKEADRKRQGAAGRQRDAGRAVAKPVQAHGH